MVHQDLVHFMVGDPNPICHVGASQDLSHHPGPSHSLPARFSESDSSEKKKKDLKCRKNETTKKAEKKVQKHHTKDKKKDKKKN